MKHLSKCLLIVLQFLQLKLELNIEILRGFGRFSELKPRLCSGVTHRRKIAPADLRYVPQIASWFISPYLGKDELYVEQR